MGNYEAEHVLAPQDLAKAALCSGEGTKNPLVETGWGQKRWQECIKRMKPGEQSFYLMKVTPSWWRI